MESFSHVVFPLLSFIVFVICLYKWLRNPNSKPVENLPPSPTALPFIGNLHQIGKLPHRSLQSLSKKYGPLMLLHFGQVPVLVASSAESACEIMKNQDLIFSNRPKSSMAEKLFNGTMDVAFSPYGEYWRQVRSICVLQLLSNKKVQSFRGVREEETSNMIEEIRQMGASSRAINLSKILSSMSMNIICVTAFGRKYSNEESGGDLKKLVEQMGRLFSMSAVGDCFPCLTWVDRMKGLNAKVDKAAKEMDEFLERVLTEHRNQEDIGRSNFIDILLDFQRDNEHSTQDDVIKAIIWDMFVGGTDTTSTTLEWIISELLRHPKSLQKLQKEVREIAATKEELTENNIDKMHYLKAVIKESLRLHSTVPLLVPRESMKDTKVMGFDVKAGTQVIVNSWAIGRDPLTWEDSENFNPERFLQSNIDYRGLHFELIPFGAGRRGCPGITFATSVVELALAKLVHCFDIVLPNGDDLDMSEISDITLRRKFPLVVALN